MVLLVTVAEVTEVFDVTLSLPHLVGGQGVLASFPLPLTREEWALLHDSAEVICQAIEALDAGAAGE